MFSQKDSYKYAAHGLTIESPIFLPDLLESDNLPDVKIVFGKLDEDFLAENLGKVRKSARPGFQSRVSPNGVLLDWEFVGKVLIRNGSEVIIEPQTEILEDLQPFLTGPVLAILLHQRGNLVLHGSAVNSHGAIAFLGAKGFGKSTLAASMQVRGHQLITDDILPVSFQGNQANTFPGYPKIKLFPDSVEAVGEVPEHLPLIHRWVTKRAFQCAENFRAASVRLNGIYILSYGDETAIKQLDMQTAFIEITRNSHLASYLEALDCRREHFEQCQKLVQTVPVFVLQRMPELESLPEVCALLENHSSEISRRSELRAAA